jgi:hypothetical protein
MLKLGLILNCDGCGRILTYSRLVHWDNSAISVHSENHIRNAQNEGWHESLDCNSHYCRSCLREDENLTLV